MDETTSSTGPPDSTAPSPINLACCAKVLVRGPKRRLWSVPERAGCHCRGAVQHVGRPSLCATPMHLSRLVLVPNATSLGAAVCRLDARSSHRVALSRARLWLSCSQSTPLSHLPEGQCATPQLRPHARPVRRPKAADVPHLPHTETLIGLDWPAGRRVAGGGWRGGSGWEYQRNLYCQLAGVVTMVWPWVVQAWRNARPFLSRIAAIGPYASCIVWRAPWCGMTGWRCGAPPWPPSWSLIFPATKGACAARYTLASIR